jgi:hypothetical protein
VEVKVRKNTLQLKKDYNPPTTHPQGKLRKNALQIKKEIEEEEKEMLEKEKVWEVPTFLRKKN